MYENKYETEFTKVAHMVCMYGMYIYRENNSILPKAIGVKRQNRYFFEVIWLLLYTSSVAYHDFITYFWYFERQLINNKKIRVCNIYTYHQKKQRNPKSFSVLTSINNEKV